MIFLEVSVHFGTVSFAHFTNPNPIMSKFWGGSSSEEEPSEDQESSSEEVGNAKKSQWMMDSDSDDDNVKRVVKSKDQKQKEELRGAANRLKTALKTNEWGTVQKGVGVA